MNTFIQSGTTWTFSVGNLQLKLDTNGKGLPEHAQVIDLLNDPVVGEAKRTRLEELMLWNHNYAYVIFISENNIFSVPPPEQPITQEETP